MAEELAETASHPEFLRMMESVQGASPSDRRGVAADVARIDNVIASGIPIPHSFRITTRTFEDPEFDRSPPMHDGSRPTITFDGHSGAVVQFLGRAVTIHERGPSPSIMGTQEEVKVAIKSGIESIARFVASAAFQKALYELSELPLDRRVKFVTDELIDPARRTVRGITSPEGMVVQRSEFADGRPTLFCVSMVVPSAYPWHKVTLTFDNG